MPRPIRIQYPGAVYHVMNHGRLRHKIFHGPEYYTAFLQTLEEASLRFDAQVHAYCLMDNHYHLLIGTPGANLDRIMRHINGLYTQRYNRLKGVDGTLFKGRYKAVLIDSDEYLLQVGRYIHRIPAQSKAAKGKPLDKFFWSSYPAYIDQVAAPDWLDRETSYKKLGKRSKYAAYRAYVKEGNSEEFSAFYSKGNLAAIMGGRPFKDAIKKRGKKLRVSGDLSKLLIEKPEFSVIVAAISKVFKTVPEEITQKRGGRQQANDARKMAVYCCQQLGGQSLKLLAENFNYSNPGSVSTAIATTRKRLQNGELVKEYAKIERIVKAKK